MKQVSNKRLESNQDSKPNSLVKYMKKKWLILILLLIVFDNGCFNFRNRYNYVSTLSRYFDISDSLNLLISKVKYRNEWHYCLYSMNGEFIKDLEIPDSVKYDNPYFISDSIISFKKFEENYECIVFYNHFLRYEQKILYSTRHINSYLVSKKADKIYYVASMQYGVNSPIAEKSFRGMDVFEYDVKSKSEKRLTNLNEFTINGLCIDEVLNVIYFVVPEIDNNSIFSSYVFSLYALDLKTNIKTRINLKNPFEFVGEMKLSEDRENIFFVENLTDEDYRYFVYELFRYNLKFDSVEKLTNFRSSVGNFKPFAKDTKIFTVINSGWPDSTDYHYGIFSLESGLFEKINVDTTIYFQRVNQQ